eukprot:scaffold71371_cov80-Phaeocystis_antarctica.AAC.2
MRRSTRPTDALSTSIASVASVARTPLTASSTSPTAGATSPAAGKPGSSFLMSTTPSRSSKAMPKGEHSFSFFNQTEREPTGERSASLRSPVELEAICVACGSVSTGWPLTAMTKSPACRHAALYPSYTCSTLVTYELTKYTHLAAAEVRQREAQLDAGSRPSEYCDLFELELVKVAKHECCDLFEHVALHRPPGAD